MSNLLILVNCLHPIAATYVQFLVLLLVQPIRISDLQKVDPIRACEYFNSCFKDPSTFTVVIVGNIDPKMAIPLILQYLVRFDVSGLFNPQGTKNFCWLVSGFSMQGGIPKSSEPVLHFNRDDLKGLPFTFPASIIRYVDSYKKFVKSLVRGIIGFRSRWSWFTNYVQLWKCSLLFGNYEVESNGQT